MITSTASLFDSPLPRKKPNDKSVQKALPCGSASPPFRACGQCLVRLLKGRQQLGRRRQIRGRIARELVGIRIIIQVKLQLLMGIVLSLEAQLQFLLGHEVLDPVVLFVLGKFNPKDNDAKRTDQRLGHLEGYNRGREAIDLGLNQRLGNQQACIKNRWLVVREQACSIVCGRQGLG